MGIKKVSRIFYENYFWVVVIDSLIGFLLGKHYLFSVVLPIFYYFLAIKSPHKKFSFIDIFVLLIFFCDIISWLLNDYKCKTELIFRHIMGPLAYMVCYYIGKNYKTEFSYSLFKKGLLPALITSIIGLYCFFFNPSWYTAMVYSSMTGDVSVESTLEAFRLRSIFPSPYTLSYFNAILLSYIFFKICKDSEPVKKYYVYIAVFLVTCLFCMMRAPLGMIAVSILGSVFYLAVFKNRIKQFIIVNFCLIVLALISFTVLSRTNKDNLQFMQEKIDLLMDKDESFIEDRYKIYDANESLFGDGAGRHNLWADEYVKDSSIKDAEYQKIKQEVGFFGYLVYLCLFAFVLLKIIINIKELPFEFCVMIFLLVSMIGAAPLSTPDKHCFLFWIVMGRVSSFKRLKKCVRKSQL